MARPNPLQLLIQKLPKPLQNKYFVVLVVFFFLLVFVDKHDLVTQFKLKNSNNRLEHDKAYYERKIEEAKQDKQNMEVDKEKFAREKYHMHKADEEVFIIPEEKKD